jgi:hypothetical protein
MESIDNSKFVFYILLDNKIPESFYQFDLAFKKLGWTLIPIAVDQIQLISNISDQVALPVLCSTKDFNEFKSFNKSVRDILKFLLRSERVVFFKISSFDKLNDEKKFYRLKNYFFINYPQSVHSVTSWIIYLFEVKSNKSKLWPGGKRVGSNSLNM